jgi:hypothetical protein
MTSLEGVALLALCYAEMEVYPTVGPRIDGTELFDDLEAGNPNVSLLTMFASEALRERDWQVVKAMDAGPRQLSELLPSSSRGAGKRCYTRSHEKGGSPR